MNVGYGGRGADCTETSGSSTLLGKEHVSLSLSPRERFKCFQPGSLPCQAMSWHRGWVKAIAYIG